MKVREIMKEAKTIAPDATIKEAAARMNEFRIGSLVVLEKGKIIGIITERDILSKVVAAGKGSASMSVRDLMTANIITIEPEENIEEAASIMSKHKIKKLPVVSGDRLVGIITATDIVMHADEIGELYLF